MANIVELQENGVAQYIKTHAKAVIDAYEVGDIHISTKSDNPSERFGGTWEPFGEGRTLVGVNTTDTSLAVAGKYGGSINPLTSHSHTFSGSTSGANIIIGSTSAPDFGFAAGASGAGLKANIHTHSFSGTTQAVGDNTDHNNWQPFVTVYMWVKTA